MLLVTEVSREVRPIPSAYGYGLMEEARLKRRMVSLFIQVSYRSFVSFRPI